jgi:hypothetical protein
MNLLSVILSGSRTGSAMAKSGLHDVRGPSGMGTRSMRKCRIRDPLEVVDDRYPASGPKELAQPIAR